MDEAKKIVYCSLKSCQSANNFSNQFCSRCNTPLVKRYLWVVGTSLKSKLIDQTIVDRYWVISEKLVLDTKPAIPPDFPEQIPAWLKPYLKLSPYRLHIPKIYGQIPRDDAPLWLVESENFSSTVQDKLAQGEFLPLLEEVWKQATPTRQLNWLLQMSQLWTPLKTQGVAKTLLTPQLLHVNGAVIQLRELPLDDKEKPVNLKDLGKLWSKWVDDSQGEIQSFFQQVCERLIEGDLHHSEGLVSVLEDGLTQITRSQNRFYEVATASDSGPSRSRNEDAYYQNTSSSENSPHPSSNQEAVAIVCDGVGGHQGGEVASQLAIDHLQREIKSIQKTSPNPRVLIEKIEKAVGMVNDVICDQNDLEKRQNQQRMGTTLVMTVTHDHAIYITHVGDSRVYWITTEGCYQLTLDDDLASRQTRLGHLFYREALQQPSAGALVQALGMSSSKLLHPTTQRLIVDEDCIFLLCSDGLSDNGLVELYWEQEILPLLEGKQTLNTAVQRLIHLANTLNGHDNVTVSLVRCSVSHSVDKASSINFQEATEIQDEETDTATPEEITSPPQRKGFVLLMLIVVLVIAGMGMTYWFVPGVRHSLDQFQERLKGNPMRDPSDLPSP